MLRKELIQKEEENECRKQQVEKLPKLEKKLRYFSGDNFFEKTILYTLLKI